MAWSTGRTGGHSVLNKHSFRVILLIALAWIVVYNFMHYEVPRAQEPHETTNKPRKRPHRVSEINIAAAGPQIGTTVADIVSEGGNIDHDVQIPVQPDPPPAAPVPVTSTSPAREALTEAAKHSAEESARPPHKWLKTANQDPADTITRLTLTRTNPYAEPPSLLALVMTKDSSSWGSNGPPPRRTFASYLSMMRDSGLNLSSVAIALLTSSESEFKLYESLIEQDEEQFGCAMVILHPGYANRPKPGDAETDWRANRHDSNIQHDRRAEMARLRNYLMFNALGLAPSARNVLWIDADVYELSPNLIQNMVSKMDANEQVGVVTVISHFGGGGDYDLNAYRGGRSKPNEEQRQKLRENIGSWTAGMQGGHHIHHVLEKLAMQKEKEEKEKVGEGAFDPTKAEFDLEKRTDDRTDPWWEEKEVAEVEGLLRLDAVGATVVMLKTSLVNQGLAYSTSYLVGTDWESEGWDAVESEGLCVTARTLGAKCFAMIEGFSRHAVG